MLKCLDPEQYGDPTLARSASEGIVVVSLAGASG